MLTLVALLDRRLPDPHRQRVVNHVRQCETCYFVVHNIADTMAEIGDRILGLDKESKDTVGEVLASYRALLEELATPAVVEHQPNAQGGVVDSQIAGGAEFERGADDGARTALGSTRRRLIGVVAAAGAAALIALGFVVEGWLSPRRARVAESAPPARPFVARFTGHLPWAPVAQRPTIGATGYHLHLPKDAVGYAFAARRGRPAEAPNAGVLGTVGASQVLIGGVDSGVETLRRAAAARPGSAELLNDLGGALLSRFEASERRRADGVLGAVDGDRDGDLLAALEAIERALEISPRLEQALFNRALALEWLHLPRSARQAWQSYVDLDSRSPWAREARQRLAAITIPERPDAPRLLSEIAAAAAGGDEERLAELVLAHRQLARRSVQEELLPGWAEAWLAGDVAEASRLLGAAAAIAREWEDQTTERRLRDAVAEIQASRGDGRERLAIGYQAFGEASRAFAAFDLEAAQTAAERAQRMLPSDSPAAAWAGTVLLGCKLYGDDDVEQVARQLVDSAGGEFATIGRALWGLGLQQANRGQLTSGLATLRDSLDAYERVEEVDSVVWLRHLVGEVYGYMGLSDACWSYRRLAHEQAPALTDSARAFSILLGSAMLALFDGRPRAAADLLDEAVMMPHLDEPAQVSQGYLWRSRILRELGREAEARSELQRATVWMSRAQAVQRQFLSGDLHLAAGLLEPDPARGVERISRALGSFHANGLSWRLPGVLLARARARLRTGDHAAADADLRQGLVLLDEQSSGGRLVDLAWARQLDGPDELFGERVRLALRRSDAEEALRIAETGRARSLRALSPAATGADSSTLLELHEARRQIGPETTLLVYSWFPDRVVLWRLTREETSLVELPRSPAELAQLVAALRADLEAGAWTETTREMAMRLHAALVGPARPRRGRLVIVTDDELHGLPFAALIDPRTGRFLLHEHEVTVAPSIGTFARGQAAWTGRRQPPTDALVVGNPRADPLLFPWLDGLAGSRDEARAVATLYPRRELLLDGAATRAAFVAGLGRRAVVHFAGHALPNRVEPSRSGLPLAPDIDEPSGLLLATDIAKLDLTNTRMVVLSACETGIGADDDQGPLSLARAFLAAGAPTVVASLWPVADAPSAPLMIAFHRRLRRGERPAEALRNAQIEMQRSRDRLLSSPAAWAAFETFGG